jgi:hypothetical protein
MAMGCTDDGRTVVRPDLIGDDMNKINRWKEYDAGTLTPPCVVQHDVLGKENLIWVWTGTEIKSFSRDTFDEESILADAMIVAETVVIDPKDVIIEELQTKVATLESEKAVLISEKAILDKIEVK